MLKLREIEISGFKSLPDRTKVEINRKLTIIVGPNGSGKSNVADAVLWAIGEQSAKSLRGSKMADVIFHGTKKRPPSGCAEVFLLFEREDREKVKIGRRLTRNGESSYLLDDKQVRLKDIHEFCYRNNISVQGSFLVEQGRVEAILGMSPEERKTLFEEVAGIAHYKENKKSAESKLESTKNNLLRLTDIIMEVESEMGELKKQAQRADRYIRISDELTKKRREFFGRGLWEAKFNKSHLKNELALYYEEREKRSTVLSSVEAQLESSKLKKNEEETFASQIIEQLHELDILREKKESENKRRFDQIVSSKERLRQIESDLITLEEKEKERRKFLTALLEKKKILLEEKKLISSDLEKNNIKLKNLKSKFDELGNQIQEKQKTIFSIAEERSSKKSTLAQIIDELKRIDEREQRLKREAEKLVSERQRAEENLFDEEAYLKEKTNALSEKEKEHFIITSQIEDILKEAENLSLNNSTLEKTLAAEESRLKVLFEQDRMLKGKTREEMEKENPILCENRLSSILSSLPEKTLKVLELILGELLTGYKVEKSEDVISILKKIKNEPTEKITFLSDQIKIEDRHLEIGSKYESFVGYVDELEGFPTFLKNHLKKIPRFSKFDDALDFVIKNQCEALASNDSILLTPSGWICQSPSGELSLPSLKTAKEIETTKRKIEKIKKDLEEIQKKQKELRVKESKIRDKEKEIAEEMKNLAKIVQEGRLSLQEAESELKRISAYEDLQRMEESELKRTKEELESEKSKIISRLSKIDLEMTQVETLLSYTETEKSNLLQDIDKTSETYTQKRLEETATDEKIKSLENEEQNYQKAIDEFVSSKERLLSEKEILNSKIKKLEQAILDDEESLSTVILKIQEGIEKRANFENTISYLEEEIKKNEKLEKEARENLTEIEKEISENEKELALVEAEEKNILERFSSYFDEDFDSIIEEFKNFTRFSNEEREKIFSDILKLDKKIQEMGPQNLLARDEYEKKSKKHKFLSDQKKDLEEAISGLNDTIRKINETIKNKYLDAFESVNKSFSKLFKIVFEGGEGYLKLEDPENPLESGIEIFAQPSGKKVVHNIQLSGGEKALVALTLLFSILSYRPQPFFVLDEIDAPLDETNIEKVLSNLLTEFTDKTQFIVISHNKRTMELADSIYGVTMQESGVSKFFSISLKEADHKIEKRN